MFLQSEKVTVMRALDQTFPLHRLSRKAVSIALTAVVAGALGLTLGKAHASEGRVDKIKATGKMQVCVWPGYYGVTFRNNRDYQLRGIDVDLAKYLSAEIGVPVDFVDSSFASFMDDLDTDKCDIAMFAIGHTEARQARVDLTEPHLRSGMYAVTTKTNTALQGWGDLDKSGRVLAVQKGTVMEPYMLQNAKQAEIRVIVPPATREEEVLSGRADAFLTDYPYSRWMLVQHDWARVIVPPSPVNPVDYGFAVKKGQPEWLAYVNAFIRKVRADGRLLKAAKANDMEPIVVLK